LSYQIPKSDLSDFLADRIESTLGSHPVSLSRLSGGSIAEVYQVKLADGTNVAVKVDLEENSELELEGSMLKYLAHKSSLPVPQVYYSDKQLLIMELLSGKSDFSPNAQIHAAELLSEMHDISAPNFGFEYDTLIGGLHQPNTWTTSWLTFFREQRLLYMGQEAFRYGRLSQSIYTRLETLAAKLDDYLEEPSQPSLLHGDAWSGNILSNGDRITAFLDPAIYYGHAEIELAFTTLFGTFNKPFFERYQEIRPLQPGFMEVRKDIYNLFPLLVHVRLFGGSYVEQVDRILRRFGI
jgi:fructosamine-3-kinase